MKELSLYIHIPFCKQKCLYCDFLSFGSNEEKMDSYVDALCKEILMYKNYTFKTIFIGGGTPTYLSYENINKLKNVINQLDKSKDIEFTVEGNPGTFTKEKLCLFKEMGVNRLSIGLQAWQNNLLKKLGRIHSNEEFVQSFFMAKEAGIDNINADLMFGLPNQTLEMWKETLEEVVKLNPEHLSCYSLIIEEDTPFYDMYEKNAILLPGEEIERDMYRYTIAYLKDKGYEQYEISNFSKANRECKHNLVYWGLDEYVGCGLGAHGYINGTRIENIRSMTKYIEEINENKLPIEAKIENSFEDNVEEFVFLGLRKIDGISKKEFYARFDKDIYEVYGKTIEKFLESDLLKDKDGMISLTPKGIEFSNLVMSEFILN